MNDGADALAFVHEIERVVDLIEAHGVRDHLVDFDLAVHVLLDHARQLRPAFDAAERTAAPDAARHELERPRADLLARRCDADDDRLTPATVTALERRAHQARVADALERIVDAPLRHADDDLLHGLVE